MSELISRQKLIEDMKRKCVGNCLKCEHFTILSSDYHCGVIDDQPPADQWIPCSERLPEDANEYEVTVYFDGLLFTTSSYYSTLELRWATYTYNIIAWRERLPEPYKGVE